MMDMWKAQHNIFEILYSWYMSATLLEVAREYRSVVAVVGKGHLQGIKKYWQQPVEDNDGGGGGGGGGRGRGRKFGKKLPRKEVNYPPHPRIRSHGSVEKKGQMNGSDCYREARTNLRNKASGAQCAPRALNWFQELALSSRSRQGGDFVISIDGPASPVLGDPSTGIDAAAAADRTEVTLFRKITQESCQEVKAVIGLVKPQVVFLELCPSRKAVLRPQNLEVASKLEVCPGSEFRVACEEALKYDDNVQVKLGDRPVQLKEMDDVDILTRVVQDMSKQFPTLMETLVHERDQYMSATLLEVARTHSSIVAVVGKGHLEGIKKYWKKSDELEHLQHADMPLRRLAISAVKLLTTVGVAAAGVAMISGLCGGWLF
ncbi:hypothetical protein C3L33_11922, partial [Rhododendron williamsianum]